jgi:acyl-coenzyme A thioesterase PaaI-like protein
VPEGDLVAQVRAAVATQAFMRELRVGVTHAAPGEVDLAFPLDGHWTHHHGLIHAGVVAGKPSRSRAARSG